MMYFKNIAAFAAWLLKCVWPFWNIILEIVKLFFPNTNFCLFLTLKMSSIMEFYGKWNDIWGEFRTQLKIHDEAFLQNS